MRSRGIARHIICGCTIIPVLPRAPRYMPEETDKCGDRDVPHCSGIAASEFGIFPDHGSICCALLSHGQVKKQQVESENVSAGYEEENRKPPENDFIFISVHEVACSGAAT